MLRSKRDSNSLMPLVVIGVGFCMPVAAAEKADDSGQNSTKTGLEWEATAGVGYDSNIYRAPGSAYINYANSCVTSGVQAEPNCIESADNNPTNQKGYVLVEPESKSGVLIPAKLKLDYRKSLGESNFLVASYKANGDFYADSQYNNANSYGNKIRLGDELVFATKHNQQHAFYAGGLYEYKKRLYLDRDTGEEQEYGQGVDISKRYTYNAMGLEGALQGKFEAWQYELDAAYQDRNYEDPVVVSQYDNVYQKLGGKVKYKLSKSAKLTFAYSYYTYDYDERPARSADGRLLKKNPPRKYEYNKYNLTLRQRLTSDWLMYLDYEHKTRTDKFEGYDDYDKDLYKVRLHYKVNKKNKVKLSYAYWERNYPNAFAFDNADIDATAATVNIAKDYDGSETKLSWTSDLDEHKAIVVDVNYTDENSTDLRYDFSRYQTSLSMQWQY